MVEKEYKNSPDDMETINMWAEKSSRVADDRSSERPLRSTSTPANVAQNDAKKAQSEADAVTVITRTDAAKIRKDSEIAIKNDGNVSYQKADSDVRFRGEDGKVLFGMNAEDYYNTFILYERKERYNKNNTTRQ